MIQRNLITLSLSVSILLFACSGTSKGGSDSSILSGTVSGLASKQLYMIDLLKPKAGPVDTAYVDENGRFSFDYQPTQKGFFRITLSQSFALILPLEAGEEIKVLGDINQLQDLTVSGSKDAERMNDFNKYLKEHVAKGQQLEQEFQKYSIVKNRDSLITAFRNRYATMEAEKVKKMKSLIDDDPSLFSNLAVIEQMPSDQPEDAAYYTKVDEALADKYGTSPYYTNFHAQVLKITRFAVGSEVPEIDLPSPEGGNIALSSLRGQVVLIDFWASWCKPCRMENPNVVSAYNKYKDKGFTVFGVSLDRNQEAWVNAIAQDNLTWTHVSDLKFWSSQAARDYGVSGIPFAVLIDKEGKVIGKNLRGAALHKKLEEVLN